MRRRGFFSVLRQKQYIIAGTLVVIAAVGTTVIYGTREEKERARLEAEIAREMALQSSEEVEEETAIVTAIIPPASTESEETVRNMGGNAIDAAEAADEVADIEYDIPEAEPESESMEIIGKEEGESSEEETEAPVPAEPAEAVSASSVTEPLRFEPSGGILWPMEGNVILNYSMDSTIYFPTLEQYKYNPAIVISGEVNSKVYSVAKGKVLSIVNNEETGMTMTVDLGDGYQAVYGQLKEPNFKEGDYVESGHVLAYVAEPTKYYSVEGSNLYFELLKDGIPIDPIAFFE